MSVLTDRGPLLAVGIAAPFWVERLVDWPRLDWPNGIVATLCLVLAVLAWVAVMTDRNWRFWHGSTIATSRWLALAGYTIAPTIVIGLNGQTLTLVALGMGLSVAFLSPVLSQRIGDAIDRALGGEEFVSISDRLKRDPHEIASAWEAVKLCPPGHVVPPCWHPCLGTPSRTLT